MLFLFGLGVFLGGLAVACGAYYGAYKHRDELIDEAFDGIEDTLKTVSSSLLSSATPKAAAKSGLSALIESWVKRQWQLLKKHPFLIISGLLAKLAMFAGSVMMGLWLLITVLRWLF